MSSPEKFIVPNEAAAPWQASVRDRTLRSLSLDDASVAVDLTLRCQHRVGTIGALTLASLIAGKPEIVRRDTEERISFASARDVVDAGWATTGPMIDPWVGGSYWEPEGSFGGIRLLVLGETSHDDRTAIGDAPSGLTIETVLRFQDGEHVHFHSRVTKVLEAVADASLPDHRAIWDRIAFANIVPVVAAGHGRQRPTNALFHLSSPYLEDLFERLQPDAVMAFGKTTWRWLNWALVHSRAQWSQEPEAPRKIRGIPAGYAVHPSGAMSYSAARSMLSAICEMARAAREQR